ncbi:flagellar biosynthetic protein FliR [Gammaproteobacteria bacterium 45_16_T64]|nr:flagellar biosynthetic protein FliR [Gammaproteobacteria bacterium 45_16_T64]
MEVAVEYIYTLLGQYIWTFSRVGAFFMVMPIVSTPLVSTRLRLSIALSVTLIIAMGLKDEIPVIDPFSLESMVIVAQQVLIGAVMAFTLQILFQMFVVGGQMVAMQSGLGFGTLMDPVNGINVTSISQLYLMSINLLFFTMNGHLTVISMLSDSFYTLPIGQALPSESLMNLVRLGSWLFASGLLVAWPAVISLLVVNFTFGVISRVAPQMNIISIGFPFTMVTGLIIIWLTLPNVLPQFDHLSSEAFVIMRSLVR